MSRGRTRRALLIGTELYEDALLSRLPSTRADLTGLAEVLENPAIGGFDVSTCANPTADQLRAAVATFCDEVDDDDFAVLYISGHGARADDGEFVFIASDTDVTQLDETGVRAGFVNSHIENCFARQKVVILDTCESGGFTVGFRTRPAKSGAVADPPAARAAPMRAQGVYVLASSDIGEKSYSGRGSTEQNPLPSVFTDAIINALNSGDAGSDASGYVSVDDLFDSVRKRLLSADPPQRAVKSANRVSGSLVIASRPLGRAITQVADHHSVSTDDVETRREPDGVPRWPDLLGYYTDVVRAEAGDPPLIDVRSESYVVVPGPERALAGVVDADGCLPLPPESEQLIHHASVDAATTLWMGWPAVVLYPKGRGSYSTSPQFAPLLIRPMEIVRGEAGVRLRPAGFVAPHLGLAAAVRTGSRKKIATEAEGLSALLRPVPPGSTIETRRAEFRHGLRQRRAVEQQLVEIAQREVDLLTTARRTASLKQQLGYSAFDLDGRLGPGWRTKAGPLARASFFGDWRRRRFLASAGLSTDDPAATCNALAQLAALDGQWKAGLTDAASAPADEALTRKLVHTERAAASQAIELVKGQVEDLVARGRRQVVQLERCSRRGDREWKVVERALDYLPAWSLSSLSAQRFPTHPALFDLVIIDEASQCSIPSVVPLLFRARRALVIGDAMQLPHISTVNRDVDTELRRRWDVSRDWLAEHQLSPVRHSAFAAAEDAVGAALLLDEHYRCHPSIAQVSNRLFYHETLAILTDLNAPGRIKLKGRPIEWLHVNGKAERGRTGRSWRNQREAEAVVLHVQELLEQLPPEATIGVVTPYRAQSDEVEGRLGDSHDRVRVGTAHKFQGGERDVIVLSLVAADNERPNVFDWADQQPELWNVAITRARSKLVVVGDESVWAERGGVGGELLREARSTVVSGPAQPSSHSEDDMQRLYDVLSALGIGKVELGVAVHGHRADAVVIRPNDGMPRPILLDAGPAEGVHPGAHLRRVLDRVALLGVGAVRIPTWRLSDDPQWILQQLTT